MKPPQPPRAAPPPQPWWDLRAAINFMAGGAGSGVLLFAAAGAPAGVDPRWPIALGLALIGAGLFAVWLEIGRPWRALHVLFHPRTSWMSREALVALLLYAAGAAAFVRPGAFLWLAGALAAVFLYSQARILRAARGIPAWRQSTIVPLILATGTVEGAGLALLLGLALDGVARPPLAAVLGGLLVLRLGAWYAYRRQLHRAGAPAATFAAWRAFAARFLGLGHLLPGLLLVPALAGGTRALYALAAAAAVLAGWAFKLVLVTRAGYQQGLALPVHPVRGAGRPAAGVRPGWQGGKAD